LHWEPPARSAASNNNTHAKSDPLAPSRSSIRRQRTVRRPHRNNRPGSASSNRPAGYVPFRSSMPQWVETLSREILGDGAATTGTAATTGEPAFSRYSSSQDNESRLDWPASNSLSTSSSSQTRRELGQQLARDALRYPSPGRRIRIPRESSLRFEMLQPPSWPPSSSSAERSRRLESSGNAPADSRLEHRLGDIVSFSPRFAPAYPSRSSNDHAMLSSDSNDVNMPLLRRVGHRSVADTSDVMDATRPRHIIDGLGDRDRSFSPGGDDHDHDDEDDDDDDNDDDDDEEHNMWETLFTTITPDDHLPSFDSSFTSATASASTAPSNRSSANSSQSTLPSSLGANSSSSSSRPPPGGFTPFEPFSDQINHCDFFSSSEGSDTEPESDMEPPEPTWRRLTHGGRRRGAANPIGISAAAAALEDTLQHQRRQLRQLQQHQQQQPTQPANANANPNPNPQPTTNMNTTTTTTATTNTTSSSFSSTAPTSLSSSSFSSSTPTPINVSFGQSSSMEDLQQVQAIIDQLTRRQDINDEWWAAMGLSRNLGRGVTDVPARNGNGSGTGTGTGTSIRDAGDRS
ncbi:hypothetical protein ACJ72_07727, partial [Emergomyces africanus]